MPDITHPCRYIKRALMPYKVAKNKRICAMAAKSIEPVPVSVAIKPSNNFVVAFPKIFGPKMENTVEAAAQISTKITAGKKRDKYASSLRMVPLKSFAFSPGIIAPGPCIGRPVGLCAIMPIPPLKADFAQSRDKCHRCPAAARACQCQPRVPRPKRQFGSRA